MEITSKTPGSDPYCLGGLATRQQRKNAYCALPALEALSAVWSTDYLDCCAGLSLSARSAPTASQHYELPGLVCWHCFAA